MKTWLRKAGAWAAKKAVDWLMDEIRERVKPQIGDAYYQGIVDGTLIAGVQPPKVKARISSKRKRR